MALHEERQKDLISKSFHSLHRHELFHSMELATRRENEEADVMTLPGDLEVHSHRTAPRPPPASLREQDQTLLGWFTS